MCLLYYSGVLKIFQGFPGFPGPVRTLLTSLDENSFMNMCIVAGCDYVNILDQGNVFLFTPFFVTVVSIWI